MGKFDTKSQELRNKNNKEYIKSLWNNSPLKVEPCYKKELKVGLKKGDKVAITHINEKCIRCGMCTRACLFGALTLKDGELIFNKQKCINCGKCLRICPVAAIVERTELETAVDILKSKNYKVAIVAPSIVSQFAPVSYKKIISGILELGFDEVVEAAAGADIVLKNEMKELEKKKKLISSCCPVWVDFIKTTFPKLEKYISKQDCPTIARAKKIKQKNPKAEIIFISPCISKKIELKRSKSISCTITFEELNALLEARNIELKTLKDSPINDATYHGRIFGYSTGITEGMEEINTNKKLVLGTADGFSEINDKLSNFDKYNFLGGMACKGGCINGPVVLKQSMNNKKQVVRYAKDARINI